MELRFGFSHDLLHKAHNAIIKLGYYNLTSFSIHSLKRI
jgi:hypothetical protein